MSILDSIKAYEDAAVDQSATVGCIMIAVPITVLVVLASVLLFSLLSLAGVGKADPYFYENGARCHYTYQLIGKVTYSQKHCEVLPALTPVVTKAKVGQ